MAAAPASAPSTSGVYVVFSVDGADRLQLLPSASPTGAAPKLLPVILSFVNAPKIGRRTPAGELIPDEACGFEAFETIRAAFIGKTVRFTEDYTIEALSRVAGRVSLLPEAGGTNAAELLLQKGLATTPERPPPKMPRELHEAFVASQAAAKAAKVGLWAPDSHKHVRLMKPFPPLNANDLAAQLKGQTVKVRIDRVMSGSSLLVTPVAMPTADDPLNHQSLQLNLTGIQCPSATKRDGSGAPDIVGTEAKFHTEKFLNQRHVSVLFEGIDNFGNFLGSIVSAKGTFQAELLGRGLAKTLTTTIVHAAAKDALIAAEKDAQSRKVGCWHDFSERTVVAAAGGAASAGPAGSVAGLKAPCPTDFEGIVINIVSGDLIAVRNGDNSQTVKVSLVGVRAPKTINRDQEIDKASGQRAPETRVSYEEYTWESREFLRTKFIGHTVSVHVEYVRVVEETKEVRAVANVVDKATGENLSQAILSQGLARFFVGKTDACANATLLAGAELVAKERKLGIHSGTTSPSTKITEINRVGEKKAKHYLSFLQRGMVGNRPPTWKAVVDLVLSGSSFRVYIPREHFTFTLRLAGVVSPSTGMPGQANDPFATESKDFTTLLVQQREVDVQVETVDRGGNFIGYMKINGKNVAQAIVAAGLATASGADRVTEGASLLAAQKAAQEAKKCIWSESGAVPARQQKREERQRQGAPSTFARATAAQAGWRVVTVTDVASATTISVAAATEASEALTAELAEAARHVVQNDPRPHQPTKGEVVLAASKDDASWYRAKVTNVNVADHRADLTFLDFGNQAVVRWRDIRIIPNGVPEAAILRTQKPLAETVQLAYLKPHATETDSNDAAVESIWSGLEATEGCCMMRTEYTSDDGRKPYVLLTTNDGEGVDRDGKELPALSNPTDEAACLQLQLLKTGRVLLDRTAIGQSVALGPVLMAAQERARQSHVGLWRYGDVDEDAEDE